MIKRRGLLFAALTAVLIPSAGLAGVVGEPAAPLVVSEWLKGKPVEVKAGTNIFVVEMFTTWSLASQVSITNLNAIQERFKDQGVVVIAVSEEPAERIKQFLQRQGASIQYSVAADLNRRTTLNYMMPVRQQGVPCAFVVGRDGKLLWHGHPEAGLVKILEEVVAGGYDLKTAEASDTARRQIADYLKLAQKRDPRTKAMGRALLAARTNNLPMLCELAFMIATTPKLVIRDTDLANDALDQAQLLSPTNTTRVDSTRAVLLFETGHQEEGLAKARGAVAAAKDPQDRTNAQYCVLLLERRMKSPRPAPMKPANTNETSIP